MMDVQIFLGSFQFQVRDKEVVRRFRNPIEAWCNENIESGDFVAVSGLWRLFLGTNELFNGGLHMKMRREIMRKFGDANTGTDATAWGKGLHVL